MQCSCLQCATRSVESAKTFNNKSIVLSGSVFNEAGLPVANWQAIKLPPKIWAVVFRILWFLGYSRNSESFKEAKLRALNAVEKLSGLAREYESVLFVGHGVFNRMLSNELRRHGWLGPKNPGSNYWTYGIYER